MYLGHSRHSTDQQYITNITLADFSIPQTLPAGLFSPFNEAADEGLKLGTS